jgi:integrase
MTDSQKTRPPRLLTAVGIAAMKPDPNGAYRVPDLRCQGLAVRIAASGKTWDLSFRIKGAGVRRISLGRYEDVGLEAARRRANEITSAARQGRDLLTEEEQARNARDQSHTVEQLTSEYMRRRVRGQLRTADEIERILRRGLAPLMSRKAADIKCRDLRRLLDDVADQGLEREAGKRRQTIGAMFRWAVTQDIVESNPADGLSSYSLGKPRDRVLSDDEIRSLWRWLDGDPGNVDSAVRDILKLQLCLGARVGEVCGMAASEFTTDAKGRLLWTLPAARSKNKRQRVTPILGLAKEIIGLRSGEEILFPSPSGKPFYSDLVGQRLGQRCGKLPIAPFTSHDLRRTAATGMTKLGLSLELVSTVVGHKAGEAHASTLVRHYVHDEFIDRKADALARWDRRLRQILAGDAGKVVALRA